MRISDHLKVHQQLNALCAQAVAQQAERNPSLSGRLRQRRRFLKKHLLKRIPASSRISARTLLHAAMMLLSMWVFGGLARPDTAQAVTPVFRHIMLDGFNVGGLAVPAVVDIDGDGDLDVFVGEWQGTVKFYRNNGTNNAPNFVADAVGNPMAGFDVGRHAAPAFADIDGDGDLDVFVGNSGGTIIFYRNIGTSTAPNFVVDAAGNPLAGFGAGSKTIPSFADIDGDGDLDAFVGIGWNGTVKFYRNNGTNTAPNFVADAAGNPLAGVKILAGGAAPSFADIDGDGDLDAFIGEQRGSVIFYRNNGSNTAPSFIADVAGNPLAGFDVGGNSTPFLADIDGDGDLDAFVGEFYGAVRFYQNNGSNIVPGFVANISRNPMFKFNVGKYAVPAFVDIDGDADLDAFVGEQNGTIKFYRNNGTNTVPNFVADTAGNPLAGIAVGTYAAPAFVDIDGDGDLDAFVGEYYGSVKFYRNNGTNKAPNFVADAAGNPLAGVAVGYYATPTFADIDFDGDLDAFVGERLGSVKFYRNNGTNTTPNFVADATGNPLAGVKVLASAVPAFADIDLDGDLDAFVGERLGSVKFYRNNGTNTAPNFVADAAGNPLAGFSVGQYAAPVFADIDGDGDLDVFIGERAGKVSFFENFQPPSAPFSPTAMNSVAANSRTVRLSWQDNSGNETGFRVYRRVNKGAFSLYQTLPANTTSFTDSAVKGNRNYSYQVTAFNAAGESATSNASTVRVLAKPKGLRAKVVNGKVRLVWRDKAKGERKYLVQRKTGKGPYRTIRRLRANSKTFTDRRVKKGVVYRYRVKATGTRSSSSWSNQRRIKP